MDTQIAQEIDLLHRRVCYAFNDSTRLMILHTLSERPKYVGELVDELDIPQSTVSRHLKILRDSCMVKATREGVNIHYAIADDRVIQVFNLLRGILRDHIAEQASLYTNNKNKDTEGE